MLRFQLGINNSLLRIRIFYDDRCEGARPTEVRENILQQNKYVGMRSTSYANVLCKRDYKKKETGTRPGSRFFIR